MAAAPAGRREVHHRVPRCLLRVFDKAQGPGLEPEDLQAWLDWEEEAHRYGVDPDLSCKELTEVIEGSTVELEGYEHRALHGAAGDFARWGRLGGLETLSRYGRPWFALLARRRWEKVGAEALAAYRAEIAAKGEGGLMAAFPFPWAVWWQPPGALALLADADADALPFLARHASGDWGEVPPEDARENELSVRQGFRVLSSYPVGGHRVWIITEADRSSTCLLLPEEY